IYEGGDDYLVGDSYPDFHVRFLSVECCWLCLRRQLLGSVGKRAHSKAKLSSSPDVGSLCRSIGAEKRLDRAAFVHCTVALRHLIQRQSQIENLAWIYSSITDHIDQLRQIAANRRGPTMQMNVREEQIL